MHDLDPGVHALCLEGPLLTPSLVATLKQDVHTLGDVPWVVVDCHKLSAVTAPGLAALLELGRATDATRAIALAALSRPLLRVAIEAGLAERFAIYSSVQAFMRARAREHAAAHPGSVACAL